MVFDDVEWCSMMLEDTGTCWEILEHVGRRGSMMLEDVE